MTPETEALIARVRELDAACSVEGNNIPILLGQIADLAPQFTTALEAAEKRAEFWKTALDAEYARRIDEEKRADAAEAKLRVSRDILAVAYKAGKIAQIPSAHYLLEAMESALTQLEP